MENSKDYKQFIRKLTVLFRNELTKLETKDWPDFMKEKHKAGLVTMHKQAIYKAKKRRLQ